MGLDIDQEKYRDCILDWQLVIIQHYKQRRRGERRSGRRRRIGRKEMKGKERRGGDRTKEH